MGAENQLFRFLEGDAGVRHGEVRIGRLIFMEGLFPRFQKTFQHEAENRFFPVKTLPERLFEYDMLAAGIFCLFDGLSCESYFFHTRNFRQLEDFQLEVFHVAEAVSLSDQPSDFVVETLH